MMNRTEARMIGRLDRGKVPDAEAARRQGQAERYAARRRQSEQMFASGTSERNRSNVTKAEQDPWAAS